MTAALVQRRGVPAEQQRLGRIGGREHDGAAAAGEQLGQLVAQFLAQLEVEIGERLVEQHQARILDQRAGERGALLLPAGELGRPALQHRRQPQQLGHAVHARVDLGRASCRATRSGEAMFSNTVKFG